MAKPAILTHGETRQWLRSLGLKGVCLPRSLDRLIYVNQPGGGWWKVEALITGGFRVEPVEPVEPVSEITRG